MARQQGKGSRTKGYSRFRGSSGFLKTLVNENRIFLALDEETDKAVGILAIAGEFINQLYIHTDYQDRGIGTRLLNLAKNLSNGTLRLYTFEVNKQAQQFYEKHGFEVIGRGFENEEHLPDILYEWKND